LDHWLGVGGDDLGGYGGDRGGFALGYVGQKNSPLEIKEDKKEAAKPKISEEERRKKIEEEMKARIKQDIVDRFRNIDLD
jgi:hypothetical protein